MEQRTEEWFAARLGKVTASRVGDVMAKTKSGYSASRANYMAQLVVERMTGKAPESFTNSAMQWGTDTEPLARAAYEAHNNVMVDEVGFIDHPTIPMSGASPDGLIGEHGMLEIKCPNTATHIETLLTNKIDEKYILQMQWQMACTGRQWCDFVSFDPRMETELQLKIIPIKRNVELISEIEFEINVFLNELSLKVIALNNLKEAK
jgi:putative phage-type endonuclease